MERYFWYEEQEALIDWIYEISYDSLVELMDAVKEVEAKEDDFLFDLLNDKNYKWVAEKHNCLMAKYSVNTNTNIELPPGIIAINKALDTIYEVILKTEIDQLSLLYPEKVNLTFIDKLNKHMNVLDFKGIKNIDQLNLKLGKDFNIMKYYVKRLRYDLVEILPELIEHFNKNQSNINLLDKTIIKTFNNIYSEMLTIDNIDIGASVGVGYFVDSNYNAEILLEIDVLDDFLEDQSEDRLLLKIEHFLDKMDYEMQNDYNLVEQEEEFYLYIKDIFVEIQKHYEIFVYNYIVQLKTNQLAILDFMIKEMASDENMLSLIDKDCVEINDTLNEYIGDLELELYKWYLQELPIYNRQTNSVLYENIDILNNVNPELLEEKFNNLNIELEKKHARTLLFKKNQEIYKEQLLAHTKVINPVTKQYINIKWDDYNFKSNKKDKFIHDLFKKRK